MKEHLSGKDLVALIAMLRQGTDRTLLVVEGGSDSRLLKTCLNSDYVELVPGYGRESVLLSVSRSMDFGVPGVLGIVDADFDHICAAEPPAGPIYRTDYHDIEMTLLTGDAFERFIDNFCSTKRVQRLEEQTGLAPRDLCLRSAAPLGAARFASVRGSLGINFEGMRYERLVNRDTLEVDIPDIAGKLLQRSGISLSKKESFVEEIQTILDEGHDLRQLCNGHDLAGIISVGLHRVLANTASTEWLSPTAVEAILRTGVACDELLISNLAADLRSWENENAPYRVLADYVSE